MLDTLFMVGLAAVWRHFFVAADLTGREFYELIVGEPTRWS
jgi:hypothetical protein